ncbi:unnamed protein product [Haemonchus placei]|uniref:DPPIV_N domain-containing protein n=1 Tax=Haemonchus placei TaxID=6290 RepID=A0A0N4WQS4_HAEPC|nr:unnamed protein product [Haemonchus placei]
MRGIPSNRIRRKYRGEITNETLSINNAPQYSQSWSSVHSPWERRVSHLNKQLNVIVNQQHIWSDSKTAFHWSKHLEIYYVKTIKKNAPKATFRYVPTNANPADIGSRGSTITDLRSHDLLWSRPPFLQLSMGKWPKDISDGLAIETVSAAITTQEEAPVIDNTLP